MERLHVCVSPAVSAEFPAMASTNTHVREGAFGWLQPSGIKSTLVVELKNNNKQTKNNKEN